MYEASIAKFVFPSIRQLYDTMMRLVGGVYSSTRVHLNTAICSSRRVRVRGKQSIVYCPDCGHRFYWPRGLQLPILIILYEKGTATLKQIVGALGCTNSGAIWSLRKLRRDLRLVSRHTDDETGVKTYRLTNEGKAEVEEFLGTKAKRRVIATRGRRA